MFKHKVQNLSVSVFKYGLSQVRQNPQNSDKWSLVKLQPFQCNRKHRVTHTFIQRTSSRTLCEIVFDGRLSKDYSFEFTQRCTHKDQIEMFVRFATTFFLVSQTVVNSMLGVLYSFRLKSDYKTTLSLYRFSRFRYTQQSFLGDYVTNIRIPSLFIVLRGLKKKIARTDGDVMKGSVLLTKRSSQTQYFEWVTRTGVLQGTPFVSVPVYECIREGRDFFVFEKWGVPYDLILLSLTFFRCLNRLGVLYKVFSCSVSVNEPTSFLQVNP